MSGIYPSECTYPVGLKATEVSIKVTGTLNGEPWCSEYVQWSVPADSTKPRENYFKDMVITEAGDDIDTRQYTFRFRR